MSSGKDRGLHSQTATVNIAVLEWGDVLAVMRGFAEIFYFNLGFSKM